MYHHLDRRVLLWSLAVLGLLALPSCSILSDENRPERGDAFWVSSNPIVQCGDSAVYATCVLSFSGELTAINRIQQVFSTENPVYLRLVFDDSVQAVQISQPAGVDLPVTPGTSYQVDVQIVPSWVSYGSIEIRDADGLVFYGVSHLDTDHALNPAPPDGWQITVEPGDYDRYDLACKAVATPRVLTVEHKGHRVRMVQGESAVFEGYLVSARIVEQIDYSSVDCLDYMEVELSYTLTRIND